MVGDDVHHDETRAQRLDRNLNELLQELRVAQAGVQILFAFLLTVAFTQRFGEASRSQQAWYVATLLLCARRQRCSSLPCRSIDWCSGGVCAPSS